MSRPVQALNLRYPEAAAFEYKNPSAKHALLLIHGFTGTPAEMRPVGDLIHEKLAWTTQGILLKGHATFPAELSHTTMEDWQAQVQQAVTELKKNYTHIHLSGLSMGGLLALDYALNHPEDLTSLSLLAPALKVRSLQWAVNLLGRFKLFPRMLFPKAPSLEPEHISYRSYNLSGLGQFNRLQKYVARILKPINIPTLLIYSKVDETIDDQGIEQIFPYFQNPQNKIAQLLKSGHIVTLGKEKNLTLEKVLEFYGQF